MYSSMYRYRLNKPIFINLYVIIIILFLLLLILTLYAYSYSFGTSAGTIVLSPRFQIQETNNEDHNNNSNLWQ